MRRAMWMVLAGTLAAPALALAQDVSVDFDKDFNFSTIKTYSLKLATASGNPLSEKRAMAEIEGALTGKGWVKAEEGKADAAVMVHGASETRHRLESFYTGGGYGGYGWRGYGGMGMGGSGTTEQVDYRVGTMVVDIFDVKSKQLVFRGTASDELSDKAEKNTKKIVKATEKMFKNFPPGSEKK